MNVFFLVLVLGQLSGNKRFRLVKRPDLRGIENPDGNLKCFKVLQSDAHRHEQSLRW